MVPLFVFELGDDFFAFLVCEISNNHRQMGPVKRCMIFMVQMVNTVDQANKAAFAQRSTTPVAPEVAKEVEDL